MKMSSDKHLMGVLHLMPLGGSPLAGDQDPMEALQLAGARAIREARELEKAGFSGLIIENFGDAPFYKDSVPPETIAALAVLAGAIKEAVKIPVGINVLRNDARAALAIAATTGCEFVRINVLSGVSATDQGIIQGQGAFLSRERARFRTGVAFFADVHVKHAKSLSSDSIELAVEEVLGRGGADAVIVTGTTTGRSVDYDDLRTAVKVAHELGAAVYVGSGANPKNVHELLQIADGVIVGSYIRKNGKAGESLDARRVKDFVTAFFTKPARVAKPKRIKK